MLGIQHDAHGEVIRIKPPLRLRRWDLRRENFTKLGMTGYLPDFPTMKMDIPPIVFVQGRYIVTEGGDDFVLEERDEALPSRPTFDPNNPLEAWRRQLTASGYLPWGAARKNVARLLRDLKPPVGLTDFDAFGCGMYLTVTGIINSGNHRVGERRTFDLNFLQGRFAKAIDGSEFILYEPSVDFRRRHGGFNPLCPLAALGF